VNAPLARIVHSIPGRTRLRAPDIKGDAAALDALRTAIEGAPRVRNVSVNVLTGSLLVEHDGSTDDLITELRRRGSLLLATELREPYLTQIHRALDESDQRLKRASNGNIDLETLSFLGFLAGGVYQVFNNHALPAGVTLLRYAVELVTATALGQAKAAVDRRASAPPE
jgi:Heavy metal associated domain 2